MGAAELCAAGRAADHGVIAAGSAAGGGGAVFLGALAGGVACGGENGIRRGDFVLALRVGEELAAARAGVVGDIAGLGAGGGGGRRQAQGVGVGLDDGIGVVEGC